MQKINRMDLLNKLQFLTPGLSDKEIVEQSTCFVFRKGKILTYNDELLCQTSCDLGFEGAIKASTFLNTIRKEDCKSFALEHKKGKIVLKTRGMKYSLFLEKEITLPVEQVSVPEKWKKLPVNFVEGLSTVYPIASSDDSLFVLTCVLFSPTHLEVTDRWQACRYAVTLPIKKPFLVRKKAIQYLSERNIVKFAIDDAWIHFQSELGIISCRRYVDTKDFQDTEDYVSGKGVRFKLPVDITGKIEKLNTYLKDNVGKASLRVELKSGAYKIVSKGINGVAIAAGKTLYTGKPVSFMVYADTLLYLCSHYRNCFIAKDKILVSGKNFQYAAAMKMI